MILNEQALKIFNDAANSDCLSWSDADEGKDTVKPKPLVLAKPLCSGRGQYHTHEPGKKNRKPYLDITFEQIRRMVDDPAKTPKPLTQWLIPSELKSRTFAEQEKDGKYWALWLDFDDNPPCLREIEKHLLNMIGNVDFEIYSTRSASLDNQKCRVLIPLHQWLTFKDWTACQQILNDKFEALGIEPDRANQRAAQLCYLPNRGKFYDSISRRNDVFLDAGKHFEADILAIEDLQTAEKQRINAMRKAAEKKRATLQYDGSKGGLIDAFNQTYTVAEILLRNGYKQQGLKFCRPDSTTGNYAASINPETGRVHTLSTKDPLYVEGSQSGHDAFSCFEILEHGGDRNAALSDAGDNYLMVDGESWNAIKRREYRQQAEKKDARTVDKDDQADFDFSKFSLRGQSMALEQKLLNEVYILEEMALLGEITVFFAPPNSGKTLITLKLLFNAVDSQKIKGDDVFYINADDSLKGIATKLKLCEQHNIHMLAPGQNGFEASDFVFYLEKMVSSGSAHGKVIVLDTAKKFTSIMDKEASSKFNAKLREFSQAGGSVILLAHTNKNRNSDGQLVAGGTSDLIDDADCAFIIDVLSDDGRIKTVIFQNQKRRGGCSSEVVFSYSSNPDSYNSLIDSVETIDNPETAKAELETLKQRQKDEKTIAAIKEVLEEGGICKADLTKKVTQDAAIPRREVMAVLDRYVGDDIFDGKLWRIVKSNERNRKIIELLTLKK